MSRFEMQVRMLLYDFFSPLVVASIRPSTNHRRDLMMTCHINKSSEKRSVWLPRLGFFVTTTRNKRRSASLFSLHHHRHHLRPPEKHFQGQKENHCLFCVLIVCRPKSTTNKQTNKLHHQQRVFILKDKKRHQTSMKLSITTWHVVVLMASSSTASAFMPSTSTSTSTSSSSHHTLMMASNNNDDNTSSSPPNQFLSKMGTMAAMSFALWSGPSFIAQQQVLPTTTPSSLIQQQVYSANAKEMASGSGSRVNKDAESLLRYSLPIKNKEVRELQKSLELVKYDIQSKRKAAALDGVKKSKQILNNNKQVDSMVKACREPNICSSIITEMKTNLEPLTIALGDSQDVFRGSEQEGKALDEAYSTQKSLTKLLTTLEEQMIPNGYVTPVPTEYSDLPQLKQRATVEMVLKKGVDGEPFDVNGVNFKEAKMTMIIDGYTAPVTSGNFIDLVDKGFYNNMKIQRSDGFVVQTGDPDGEANGYTGGTPSKSIGAGPKGERLIPCEIYVKGDKGPFYESTMEDEGRGGEATVLPFSSYGAMGWARDEYDPNSGSSQFFWLLFDSDLTPAGKNVLDGRYPCFGFVTEGADFLSAVDEGDVIVSAKVTDGIQYLVRP